MIRPSFRICCSSSWVTTTPSTGGWYLIASDCIACPFRPLSGGLVFPSHLQHRHCLFLHGVCDLLKFLRAEGIHGDLLPGSAYVNVIREAVFPHYNHLLFDFMRYGLYILHCLFFCPILYSQTPPGPVPRKGLLPHVRN